MPVSRLPLSSIHDLLLTSTPLRLRKHALYFALPQPRNFHTLSNRSLRPAATIVYGRSSIQTSGRWDELVNISTMPLIRAIRRVATTPLKPLSPKEKSILDRSFTLQTHGDMILRCTEFDSEGNVVSTSRDFKKTELCTKHGLLPRDLRKLESKVIVPHILVRRNSILVNLLHIRALIKANAVLLFDVYGSTDTYTQSVFLYDLQGKLSSRSSKQMGGLPYEMRALEAILISVMGALEAELKILQENVGRLLEELEENIDRDKLRFLLIYSKKLSTFEQKAQLICGAIEEVLEADEDLAGMYLTEKLQGMERPAEEHSEIELLLESYYKMADEIVQVSGNLVANIKNTEDIVNLILDANRNSLMLLDLKFSIGTLSTGCGAALAALYGMNLKNFIEESDLAFFGVSGLVVVLSAVIFGYGLHRLRRTQRLTMWGEGNVGVAPGRKWRSVSESRGTSATDDRSGRYG
ncbi:magnesium ion transporter [Orbilia oligospora]|uniref:Magnesium transporter n=2 Tax=Orbilia oligospora TaxID=2813651 RepID=A0A7C8J596_ORBOL|nr:magnesium ion transporter [Orbilia oligospora]KAF3084290.1 magnesium ion transporter [Orbilia oligospora]KAF3108359.1 magnesium ion transporter [Orbilia oligospora]KAF3108362.1 magnesium ion transporter, variant 4 [Orbilia oligospora]KAF3127674.1 magnesium ion transporter, variant 3 [Orbilia oligospora]